MTETALPTTVPIRPAHLGPLDDGSWSTVDPCDLFPGAERYLRPALRKRRVGLWSAIQTAVDRVRDPQEQVLYVAPAIDCPGLGAYLALGVLTPHYHQVALVLTERRLIEVLLDLRGSAPAARLRSYEWSSVKRVDVRLGLLSLEPIEGQKQKWRLRHAGDRRLLARLMPRVEEQLVARHAGTTRCLPTLHCPSCTAALAQRARSCDSCGSALRSSRLATWLALAFPGAGLLYAGHPVLATFDFLAEVTLFAIVGLGLLAAGSETEIAALLPVALVLFVATKLESMHIGQVLLRRMRAERTGGRARWIGSAIVGGLLTAAALGSVSVGSGSLSGAIDRDLDFPTGETGWRGVRNAAEWQLFVDDPDLRSQWIHKDGWLVSVFAYQMQRPNEMRLFRHEFRRSEVSQGLAVFLDDEEMPDGFDGFRFISVVTEEAEDPYALVYYFVYDDEGEDLHQMLTIVDLSLAEHADRVLSQLLEDSSWIAAVKPTG